MLVQPLFDGPLDFVGDVHGEIEALEILLERLGYDAHGAHRSGRRLVFLGDLTDRGPDSPAVVRRVRSLVATGVAQCVAGNHDVNLLLGLRKYDNGWFYGEEFHTPDGCLLPQKLADDQTRSLVTSFFATLPVALERPDARAIHAHWEPGMIALARGEASLVEFHNTQAARIAARHAELDEADSVTRALEHQNLNPVKLLTSGLEQLAPQPYTSGGKTRHLQRSHWWREYKEPVLCVFGHYGIPHGKPRSFGQAFCVDYNVGKRALERSRGVKRFRTRLGALRMPERHIFFDDGLIEAWL